MAQIIIRRADGGVSIGPFKGDPEKTFEQWTSSAKKEWLPANYRVSDAPPAQPAERTFREAWTDKLPGSQIDVLMSEARIIHAARITRVRRIVAADANVEALLGNDVSVLKADLASIDADAEAAAASTPEELKARWPAAIERRKAGRP